MKRQVQVTALRLTPLTPIHIGCGIDYDPTRYVIDDGILYEFDPTRALLDDKDRQELTRAIAKNGTDALLAVQRFIHARKPLFSGVATHCVSVANGLAGQYEARVGRVAQREERGTEIINQLAIERTAHHPHSGIAYLPGSSLKGAIRTAWLNAINAGQGKRGEEKAGQVESRLLGGSFHTDPFRLLQVADATGQEISAKALFCTNHKKRVVFDSGGKIVDAKGPATRRECILGGQYAAFAGEIRVQQLDGDATGRKGEPLAPAAAKRVPGFAEIARACNRYYLKRLDTEIQLLEGRTFAEPGWLASLRTMLEEIRPRLDAGEAMLLRVGRHSGAESVTLDGIRQIRIMRGRGQAAEFSPEGAKTVWLAAENENDRSCMQPFGWLLVEPADAAACPALTDWCSRQTLPDLAAIRLRLGEARQAAAAEAARRAEQAVARRSAEAAEAQAAAERAARLATLSDAGRAIASFEDHCTQQASHARKEPCNPGAGTYALALKLSREALADGSAWTPQEKATLAAVFERWLPKLIEKLERKDDWKDARKKLRLADLRPAA